MNRLFLKRILQRLHLYDSYWALHRWKAQASRRFTNFVFQRLLGNNRQCPFSVHFTSTVSHADKLHIHPSVQHSFMVSGGCYIQAVNGIFIDEGTIFAPGVKIISSNHDLTDMKKYAVTEPIRIGKHCWIGANAVILPGVQLGDRVIVGAGSVVTKSFPSACVIAGVPAHLLKELPPANAQ